MLGSRRVHGTPLPSVCVPVIEFIALSETAEGMRGAR
jgi:hypothetical protein